MIIPIRSLENLRVGQVITDSVFDELRYGDSKRAMWINSFGSAEAMQQACVAYVERNGGSNTDHTAVRMYRIATQTAHREKKRAARIAKQTAEKQQEEGDDLAWAQIVARADAQQQYHLAQSRNKRKFR